MIVSKPQAYVNLCSLYFTEEISRSGIYHVGLQMMKF